MTQTYIFNEVFLTILSHKLLATETDFFYFFSVGISFPHDLVLVDLFFSLLVISG